MLEDRAALSNGVMLRCCARLLAHPAHLLPGALLRGACVGRLEVSAGALALNGSLLPGSRASAQPSVAISEAAQCPAPIFQTCRGFPRPTCPGKPAGQRDSSRRSVSVVRGPVRARFREVLATTPRSAQCQ